MSKDGKRIAVGLGIAGLAALIYAVTRKKKPPPGFAMLSGNVSDVKTGQALSGVLVILDDIQTLTDTNGNYTIKNLALGGYHITFGKEEYEMASKDITLQAAINELNISMTPILLLATLFGVVTDSETGAALPGVSVELYSPDGIEFLGSTFTDSSGFYLREKLLPGNYTIYFRKANYETVTR